METKMDREVIDNHIRNILLLLDGGRLLSMGILQNKHHDIDDLLADDNTHTYVMELKDSGRISNDHFKLLYPPTDLSQWDATITSHFLKHYTDLEEPQRKIMDELDELCDKTIEMHQKQEMTNEECKSEWEMIVRFLERGKALLTGPIVVEIDETLIRIKQVTVTHKDMARVKNWYDLRTMYKDSDTGFKDNTKRKNVVHDAAFHGQLATLKYMRKKSPGRLFELDKGGNQALHFAANGGHIDCLRYICESFPELIMVRNEMGIDALHYSASGGSLECLKYLISQGMDTATRSKHGSTILHEAAYGGSVSMVHFIYETFPELTEELNEKGSNALFIAAREGRIDCLKYLISRGMATDARSSKYGDTLLHVAAYGGSVPMVTYILETYPELSNETEEIWETPLHNAARGGSLECLKYLISRGMETDTQSYGGNTLLHDAAYGGSIYTLQYIWETFPELRKEKNAWGQDTLSRAAHGGSLECLKFLIMQGMSPTRSNGGNTLLHEAACGGSMSTLQYVWETFPELRKEINEVGQDILASAARGGSLDCFKYLINMGMTTRSESGPSILHQAAYCGHESIVRYLCENNFQLLACKNTHGQTAIFAAIGAGHLDILQYLLQSQNMDPKQTDKKRHTILHAAARNGKADIVRYLCTNYKFLIPMKGSKGETARDIASRSGKKDCVKIMQDRL